MTEVKKIPLKDLVFDRLNANKGTERGRYALEKSLEKYGAGRSLLLDAKGRLIAGNKTAGVAGEMGFDEVIVVETTGNQIVAVQRTDLDLEEDVAARELAIADNRVGQLDLEWQADVLQELIDDGVDISDFFKDDEIDALLGAIASEPLLNEEEDEENTADLIDKAESGAIESRVKNSDIWACGRHRVCCGDSTDGGVIKALLGDRKVSIVFSDPPYGIDVVQASGRLGTVGGSKPFGSKGVRGTDGASNLVEANEYEPIIGDSTTETAIDSFRACQELGGVQIWWGANYYAESLPPSPCWIVWDKERTGNFADVELAWCSKPSPARIFRHMWNGMIKASEHNQKRIHPTQKPVALAEWCFEEFGDRNDLIFDPFLGSGMSLMAAQKMEGDRTVYGCELSEQYCELILRRYEAFTGQAAQFVGRVDQ